MARKFNTENLKTRKLTTEEATKIGSMGGKASVASRRQRKTMRQQIELLLSLPLKSPKAKEQIQSLGIDADDIDNQMAINIAMYNMILKGNKGAVQAYNSFVDILGDKDAEKKELEIKRLREEVSKLRLEQEKLKRELGQGADTFEDLTPLGEMLKK